MINKETGRESFRLPPRGHFADRCLELEMQGYEIRQIVEAGIVVLAAIEYADDASWTDLARLISVTRALKEGLVSSKISTPGGSFNEIVADKGLAEAFRRGLFLHSDSLQLFAAYISPDNESP